MVEGTRESRERPLNSLYVDQALLDGKGLVGALPVEAERGATVRSMNVELSPQPIAPGIHHAQDLDPAFIPGETGSRKLVGEHLPLLGQLFAKGEVLDLAPATAPEVGTGWLDAVGRG